MSNELAEAFKRQYERANVSMRINRSGWSDAQWIEDAERLMDEDDGAITSLVNGHAYSLIREVKRLAGELHRLQKHPDYEYAVTFEGNTAHNDMSEWEPNGDRQDADADADAEILLAMNENWKRQGHPNQPIWWRKRKVEQ